jgi:hypothetical protein
MNMKKKKQRQILKLLIWQTNSRKEINLQPNNDSIKKQVNSNLKVLSDNLKDENFPSLVKLDFHQALVPGNYSKTIGAELGEYIEEYRKHYQKIYNQNVLLREKKMAHFEKQGFPINEEKNHYFNESLSDLVRNTSTKQRLLEYQGELLQQINPIFQEAKPASVLDYRAPFFVAKKNFLGQTMGTFIFNLLVIWVMSMFFYVTLYFELLKKVVNLFGKVSIPKLK